MKVTIDMETRSRVSLKALGVYPYAADDSTDIMCIAIAVEDEPAHIWVNPMFRHIFEGRTTIYQLSDEELVDIISNATEIHAHNAGFERAMWAALMVGKYGFDPVPITKWRDTAAKVAACALPRALADAARVLQVPIQKDKDGYNVMMRMCKPKRNGEWNEDPDDFDKLLDYCITDVDAERAVDGAVPDLPPFEYKVWLHDQMVNDRGIPVDVEGIRNLVYKIRAKTRALTAEVQQLTKGEVEKPTQVERLREWIADHGLELPDMTKATIEEALESMDPRFVSTEAGRIATRLLHIRQSASKTSTAKFKRMLATAGDDGRVRGTTMYHGAATGRYTGKLIQPHNLPRDSHSPEEVERVLASGIEALESIGEVCVIKEAAKCVRGSIQAPEGRTFVAADFASIEGRGLAWVAGEARILDNYRKGLDPYKVNAADIYSVPYAEVNYDQRHVGKTAELACGYQGWINAFRMMGDDVINAMSDERIESIVKAWRESRRPTYKFWKSMEACALRTVHTGRPHSYKRIKFGIKGDFLCCRLPSGRLLYYYKPRIVDRETPYGIKTQVAYQGTNSKTRHWSRQYTYGGRLTENIVQGLCRDILCEAMLRLEAQGLPVVMHVHDEAVVELPEASITDSTLSEFIDIMTVVPEWATGMPISAEGWIGRRYRKG